MVLLTLARTARQMVSRAAVCLVAAGAAADECEPVMLARRALEGLFRSYLWRDGHHGFLRWAGHPLEQLVDDLEQDQRPWLEAVEQRASARRGPRRRPGRRPDGSWPRGPDRAESSPRGRGPTRSGCG